LPFDTRTISSSLKKKGFDENKSSNHSRYEYISTSGVHTEFRTHMSHANPGHEIGPSLIAMMSRQVGLSKKDFEDLIRCPLSREGYEKKIGIS